METSLDAILYRNNVQALPPMLALVVCTQTHTVTAMHTTAIQIYDAG
jgi:hypothetical protein